MPSSVRDLILPVLVAAAFVRSVWPITWGGLRDLISILFWSGVLYLALMELIASFAEVAS